MAILNDYCIRELWTVGSLFLNTLMVSVIALKQNRHLLNWNDFMAVGIKLLSSVCKIILCVIRSGGLHRMQALLI